jgi:uncharacterized membrane protein HdeD (DUF308 family)
MNSQVQSLRNTLVEGLRENAGWAIGVGIVMIIAGVLSFILPFVAGLAVTAVIGATLLAGGVVQMLLAFKAGAFGRGLLIFLVGLLGAVAGSYALTQPLAALASLTLLLAAYFVATGVLAAMAAFQVRPSHGWGWMLANGIITILLGVMISAHWPLSGACAAGILVGVHLLSGGAALAAMGSAVRKGVGGAAR